MLSASEATSGRDLLRLNGVSKSLAGRLVLSEVSLAVNAGELVALLGPNGAGKTTLLGISSGRVAPDAGSVSLAGGNPRTEPRSRGKLGLVPQEIALYPYLSVRENLEVFGRMMGVSRASLAARIGTALDWSGLAERARDRVSTLSGGMRRRLNIVASLLHEPGLLMLDEPTVGVDVQARDRIHEMLRRLRAEGLGVLLTTHDLEQASSLADRVVFLVDGRVRISGAPRELIDSVYRDDKELNITLRALPDAAQCRALEARGLRATHGGLAWNGSSAHGFGAASEWSAWLGGIGVAVAEIRVREPDLEGVFLRLTGEELGL